MAEQTKSIHDSSKPVGTIVTGAILGAVGTAVALALTNKETRRQMGQQIGNLKKIATNSVDKWAQKAADMSPELIAPIADRALNGKPSSSRKNGHASRSITKKTTA